MSGFYERLKIKHSACPKNCHACVDACISRDPDNDSISVIRIIDGLRNDYNDTLTCFQCNQPACMDICPSGAINKSDIDGIVRIDQFKCAGCSLCTLGCSYGQTYFDQHLNKAFKCDLCDGKPQCVDACPYGVLSFVKSDIVYDAVKEDILPLGTSLCPGCGGDLALRHMLRVLGNEDLLTFGCPGCLIDLGSAHAPNIYGPMTTVPSMMSGASRYFRKIGKKATLLAFVGDGCASDIGFQPLSAAAHRNENIIFVCYDNEAYQNTGVQSSSTTPYGAWTMTTQVGSQGTGKEQSSKYMPLIMAMHFPKYVATVSLAYLEDYTQKILKAKEAVKNGFVYLHILSPCPTVQGRCACAPWDICRSHR
ncbi:4Fe-4S dicluster domain-containing protein [Chloroflexota bacterium]